jgi:hypothetical protein
MLLKATTDKMASETEIYTNTMPYTGSILIPPPLEGFFLCGLRITLVERGTATKTDVVNVKYINQRLEEPIQWLHHRVEVGSAKWTETMYPIPRDVIRGTKLAIELEGVAEGTLVMVKCLYLEIQDLVSKHGWAFIDDNGNLQQFALYTHESYWNSISQFHKLGVQHFPITPMPAVPSMRRLLEGFYDTVRVIEEPDSNIWGKVIE